MGGNKGMPARWHKFEVGVYNKEVRAALANHPRRNTTEFDDAWADIHWVEVTAFDSDEARAIVLRRYPESRGFVVTDTVDLGRA
jgi:hypothetical protein